MLALVIDAFTGATERHIEVGDGLEIFVVLESSGEALDPELLKTLEALKATPLTLAPVFHPPHRILEEGRIDIPGGIYVIRKELKKD